MSVTNGTQIELRNPIRERLERDMAIFLSKGGTIIQEPPDKYDHTRSACQVMRNKHNNNDLFAEEV